MNFIINFLLFVTLSNSEPKTVAGKTVGKTSPRFTLTLTHSWSVISHKNLHKNCAHVGAARYMYMAANAHAHFLNHTHKFIFMNQIGKI